VSVEAVTGVEGIRAITDDEIASFNENGWVRLNGLLSPELVSDLFEGAHTLMTTPDDGTEAPASIESKAQKVAGLKQVLNLGAWRDRRYLAAEGLEPFSSIALSSRLGRNVQQLMNREVGIHYRTDYIALKMPLGESGSDRTAWHQDIAFMPHDRAGTVNLWIALTEVTPERGSLRFLTGSHREGLVGWAEDLSVERPDLFERYEMSPPLHLQAGDATIHHSYTIHGAPANETEDPRWTYIISYFPTDVRYTGAPSQEHDSLGLTVREHFDHPRFPVIYSPSAS
jgi:ectoine hydroxylase-related dioxygenase (phytanoyl-CoA dioxygenase family)